jgi:hypothetical protein
LIRSFGTREELSVLRRSPCLLRAKNQAWQRHEPTNDDRTARP